MDSSAPIKAETPLQENGAVEKAAPPAALPLPLEEATSAAPRMGPGGELLGSTRHLPSRWHSIWVLTAADLDAIFRSWLCRGFLLVSALLTVFALKGMQAEQAPASKMLETIYATYLVIWMHAVIFISGNAFSREQECLSDAILSRGITRGEYMMGKLIARACSIIIIIGGVLLPCSFWAIRQDKLLRTETGFVTSNARNTKVEAWDPKKVFAAVGGMIAESKLEVGDQVQAGDLLATLDDRQLFHELEMERRAEENARNEVNNAKRRYEDSKRAVAQAEDTLLRAERALIAKDLMSKSEQADKETEIRSRKRDLLTAESQLRVAQAAIPTAERAVETAQGKVREARQRLGHAAITAPISGYITEVQARPAQYVQMGAHLYTISPLDEFQVRVPIYKFEEFKRLKPGLTAYVKIEHTEFTGTIDRLAPTTQADKWGRDSNFGIVRFKGNGTLGLLGLHADVRLALPPPEGKTNQVQKILNTLTGHGSDDAKTRTASVTPFWMCVGLAKILGCACLLVTLTLFAATLFRTALVAILGVTGLWHISNLLFDFAGLPDLSYLEMIRTIDKVLGGVADPVVEIANIAWLFGFAAIFGLLALLTFISRDPK